LTEPAPDINKVLSEVQAAATLAKQLSEIAECFRPYKPEVRRFRIDYLDRSSEIKYFLSIPAGVSRTLHRKVELPTTSGFRIVEVLDLDTTDLLSVSFNEDGKKWVCNLSNFPNSERFMMTLKGRVSTDFLDRLVSVKAAANPSREGEYDKYWIHSALKDVSILQRIWDELDIDRVDTDVRIGVERIFTSAIPRAIQNRIKAQKELLDAVAYGARNIGRLERNYRYWQKVTKVSPADLFDLIMKLVSGEFFSGFVSIDDPYVLGAMEPVRKLTAIVPERVKVGVQTDLNFRMPTAKGTLTFERKRYNDSVAKSIDEFLPKGKTKRT